MSKSKKKKLDLIRKLRKTVFVYNPMDTATPYIQHIRWLARNDPLPVLLHSEPNIWSAQINIYEEDVPQLTKNLKEVEDAGGQLGRTLRVFKDDVLPKLT